MFEIEHYLEKLPKRDECLRKEERDTDSTERKSISRYSGRSDSLAAGGMFVSIISAACTVGCPSKRGIEVGTASGSICDRDSKVD